MEIGIASDVTHQPSSTSPKWWQPTVATTTTAADSVLDQFQQMRSMISTFLGAHQDPKSKTVQDSRSATISTPRLNTWTNETFWPSGMRQKSFSVKYSTRPKNVRDRSQQLNRSPHFNFQKKQDLNTHSPYRILNQSPFQLCSLLR